MSDPIDLSEIETARASDEAAQAEREGTRAKVQELNARLHERVAAGESTGDRLVDHVIRRNFGHVPEAVELFRSLEERVAAHVGEPVLVVSRGIDYGRHVFGEGLQDPFVVERISIGILKNPNLNIGEDGKWSFPTDSHAVRGGLDRDKVVDGPLTTGSPGRHEYVDSSPLEGFLGTPMDHEDGFLHGDRPDHLRIAVGTVEVDALVKDTLSFDRQQYEEMLDQLLQLPAGRSD